MDVIQLAEEIVDGRRLSGEEAIGLLLEAPLEELQQGADEIRKHFCGDTVNLCTIINGRSGKCSENCKYCAQSSHYNTACRKYPFLPKEEILAEAVSHDKEGVNRFSVVTSGRTLAGAEFEKALEAYEEMARVCPELELCASHGLLSRQQFSRLKKAGVGRYHANIETSERNFPNICTTHSFKDKIDVIKMAKEEGLQVCSGGIIGMGETWEDRIDMALTLGELGVTSIPLNVLTPIPGTAFADVEPLKEEEVLRTVTLFRYLAPTGDIRLAAGRSLLTNFGESAFKGGANATITGNMLTTLGSTIESDRKLMERMGRKLSRDAKTSDSCDVVGGTAVARKM